MWRLHTRRPRSLHSQREARRPAKNARWDTWSQGKKDSVCHWIFLRSHSTSTRDITEPTHHFEVHNVYLLFSSDVLLLNPQALSCQNQTFDSDIDHDQPCHTTDTLTWSLFPSLQAGLSSSFRFCTQCHLLEEPFLEPFKNKILPIPAALFLNYLWKFSLPPYHSLPTDVGIGAFSSYLSWLLRGKGLLLSPLSAGVLHHHFMQDQGTETRTLYTGHQRTMPTDTHLQPQ